MIRPIACFPLVVMILAGCQRTEQASAPDSPGPSASASPSSDPAAVADTNRLTALGLGPIKVGMTAAEVASVWGNDSRPDNPGGPEPEICDEFHPVGAPEGVNIMIQSGRLSRISIIGNATIRTDRGFGLGDTGLAIKQAYGGAIIVQPAKYESAPAEDLIGWANGGSTDFVQDPAARGIRYEINAEGLVKIIHAGDPSIQLVEGCS